MRREARIVKLGSCLDIIENEEEEMPRAAGKTHRQAVADYLAWLQRRLARRCWPDEEQQGMQQQIDKLTKVLADYPESSQ